MDTNILVEGAKFIKDVGFPVFVAVYVLMRTEPAIAKLTQAINELSAKISNLGGK